jgi:hypothetical protein
VRVSGNSLTLTLLRTLPEQFVLASLKFAGVFSLQETLLQLCLKTCKTLTEDLGLAGTVKLKVSHLTPDGAKQKLPAV